MENAVAFLWMIGYRIVGFQLFPGRRAAGAYAHRWVFVLLNIALPGLMHCRLP